MLLSQFEIASLPRLHQMQMNCATKMYSVDFSVFWNVFGVTEFVGEIVACLCFLLFSLSSATITFAIVHLFYFENSKPVLRSIFIGRKCLCNVIFELSFDRPTDLTFSQKALSFESFNTHFYLHKCKLRFPIFILFGRFWATKFVHT